MNQNPQFPQELAKLANWVCWRLEKDTKHSRDAKVPYCPATGKRASSNNPQTWGMLDAALQAASQYAYSGIGFMFAEESGITGIDIDHCLTNGRVNEVAAAILAKLPPTYIEISPSGSGLHIFIKGTLPPGGNKNSRSGVEMYSSGRYFTMTGQKYQGVVDFIGVDSGGILDFIHQKYVAPKQKSRKQSTYQMGAMLSDDDIIRLAQGSKDGENFSALWNGQWQEKYKSQSEADFALCRKLAFWSGRNENQIDRMFRKSALFRGKWDSRHSANGQTYGEQTVTNACSMTDSVYLLTRKKEPDVFEQGGCYYRRKGDKYYQITNFVVDPIQMIASEDESQISCDLVTELGERFSQIFLSGDFSTLSRFKTALSKRTIALSFMGGEGDFELFKIYVYSLNWQKKRGVKALGIYPRNKKLVFVDTEMAFGVGGRKVSDMVQMERFSEIKSGIAKAGFLDSNAIKALAEHILHYNEPAKTIPILAWAAGCFIKPHLGVEYAFENNNDILCLHLSGIYDKYTRYRRDCAIAGEVLSYPQFRKQLEHSEFFIEKNRAKRFGNTTKKVWVIDFVTLSRRCDVSGFIRENPDAEPPEPPSTAPAPS